MATAKPQPTPSTSPASRVRRLWLAVPLLAILVLGLGWHALVARARLATAEAARLTCTCRYVANRSSQDCRPAVSRLVWLSEDASGRSITARAPLLASDRATLHEGAGCQLGPWQE
jgi:hypothetical protein